MKLKAQFKAYILNFKRPAKTSRSVLDQHKVYFLELENENKIKGIGEAAPLEGLSIDDRPDIENYLTTICQLLNGFEIAPDFEVFSQWIKENVSPEFPSVVFALETAFLDLIQGGNQMIFKNPFSEGKNGILINGLIWMGDLDYMKNQVDEKIQQNFHCIKIKVGALNIEKELSLLEYIRSLTTDEQITIRLDANGAFPFETALQTLEKYAQYGIHSIEQPIKAGNWSQMQSIVKNSPIPVALDEELIGIMIDAEKKKLLEFIKPPFIILKPTLLGGISHTKEWIEIAEDLGIRWWITSALESNVGLNAIAQFTANYDNPIPQGLGTGALYLNNIDSKLSIKGEYLQFAI